MKVAITYLALTMICASGWAEEKSVLTSPEEAPVSDFYQGLSNEQTNLRYPGESERSYFLELNGGLFGPEIDRENGLNGNPFQEVFGTNRKMWMFGGELDYQIWQVVGSLSIGLAVDYASIYGHGIASQQGERSPDSTTLKIVPVRGLLVYRFDWFARHLGVPLVPFGKAGLAYSFWWATDGNDDVARFEEGKASGGKWGYQIAGGLALELNFFDPLLGREFDRDFGVNSAFLNAQYVRLTIDNFGKEGLNLSGDTWLFGLGFEF